MTAAYFDSSYPQETARLVYKKMKLLKATTTKDVKKKRKLLKSEVERHRRERMNHSLESLRSLLLKGQPQPGLVCRRLEKAEILEHAVLFLRNAENTVQREEAGQQHFQDGVLACLKQATRFLRVEGEGHQTGRALTDALSSHRLQPSTRDATTQLSPWLPRTQSGELPTQAWQQGWKCRQRLCAAIMSRHLPRQRAPLAHTGPNSPQCHHRSAPATFYSSSFSHSQAMWRPWS